MKRAKKIIAVVLMAIIICFPTTVMATVDSVWSGQFTIRVNGQDFELWGYSTDMAIHYFCLRDMAYILNGTSAQFNIRPPKDDRWDFWIVRGEPFTPTGTEFQPIPERFATRADGAGLFGWDWEGSGFIRYPEQTLIVGIDGIDEPATTLAVRTIQDIDNTYFMASDLAAILGLHDTITTDRWHPGDFHENFIEGIDRVLEIRQFAQLPIQSPELVDILIRISGHWVDTAHFYSPIIDESITWPVEISISYHGLNEPVTQSVAPFRPEWTRRIWEWEWLWWYPMSMRILENGLVELTVNQPERAQPAWSATVGYNQDEFLNRPPRFYNYRIIVDPREAQINSIVLYIGDRPHTMRRYRLGWYSGARYTVQPAEGGGIMLRYVLNRWAFGNFGDIELRVYRHHEPLELRSFVHYSEFDHHGMELMFVQQGIAPHDRIIFEFIDHTAEYGQVHYYSLWRIGDEWRENLTPGREPLWGNIRVDTTAILTPLEITEIIQPEIIAPEIITPTPEPEIEFPANSESSESQPSFFADNWIWLVPLVLVAIIAIVVIFRFPHRR
ncbi:MAG: hypothetical protein FWB91_05025 [Defluviitaleaceae bacterium]|nr:hypothetical protein [Defluviitaleaceae bacterium]